MKSSPKIIFIEDDTYLTSTLVFALKTTYDITVSRSGKLALYKTDTEVFDLIILDLNLPDINGLAVTQQLRERGIQAPILILSGETKVLTKINLLDAGANDYLSKPFSLGELKARLRVLTRHERTKKLWPIAELESNGVILNRRAYSVSRDGQSINLRRKEFELLECLMEHPAIVISRKEIIERLWPGYDEPWVNTLDVHIKYLRDKIDRPFTFPLIHTIHGRGYKFDISPATIKPVTTLKS